MLGTCVQNWVRQCKELIRYLKTQCIEVKQDLKVRLQRGTPFPFLQPEYSQQWETQGFNMDYKMGNLGALRFNLVGTSFLHSYSSLCVGCFVLFFATFYTVEIKLCFLGF